MKSLKWNPAFAGVFAFLFIFSCKNEKPALPNEPKPSVAEAPTEQPKPAATPFDVVANFISSGWMGDGEDIQRRYVQFADDWSKEPHSAPNCVKISYKPGPKKWAGIYWQNLPDNWGNSSGEDFSKKGFKQVTFWAHGEQGGELVEFIVGGTKDAALPYKDSFRASTGKVALTKEWKQYAIDLEGKDLSGVIGGFCWTAAPSSPITFYIDDALYE